MSVEDRSGERHEVLQLGAGELFGGVALLRAQLSPCAFSALDDVSVVALPNDAVMNMVARKPSFAREMEELIEARSEAERLTRETFLQFSSVSYRRLLFLPRFKRVRNAISYFLFLSSLTLPVPLTQLRRSTHPKKPKHFQAAQ